MRYRTTLLPVLVLMVSRIGVFAQTPDFAGTVFSRGIDTAEIDSAASTILTDLRYSTGLEVANYREVEVLVEVLPQPILDTGLTEERIMSRIGLRMTAAGLSPRDRNLERTRDNYFYVFFNGRFDAFNLIVQLRREVNYFVADPDPDNDRSVARRLQASTWFDGTTGTHGQDADYLLNVLDEYVDLFLDDYLAVNAP